MERVRRLEREGYVAGYEARLNPSKLGCGLTVFAEVILDQSAPAVLKAFQAAAETRPEILECHMVAGGFDYLLKIQVPDMNAYRDVMAEAVWSLPGIRETRTFTVMGEVKHVNDPVLE